MDCNMPIMDGFEATQNLRKYYSKKQIHIAALTAYASEQFERRCLEAGMNSFFTKPVNEDKILKLLQKLKIMN